ncbi:phosphate ABC transporter substrate-binding protein PstS [Agrococcus lahaulensis]|uniref:phosphate ABC transporter substrate-binding protein PstS n=1 Tax=Agrococcus sp. SCSIO52902 TaxID=2933290 RepID=UPI000FE2F5CD|nr:phosphate ABC transporter substrate-binding protein PstS [Agrococcus sp. SCSIO52902]RWR21373.1 phosphate ABC transporter substrate-binding protein PstS [Agrococcus lahaulensis]UOV99789.1 phosphate ABC transporter substrate-binding protein PstS [Agrococcus sp. SCSIO52902]
MKFTKLGRAAVVAAAGALLLSSCAANEPAAGPATDGSEAPESTLSGDLAGAGASSMGAAQEAWIAGFQSANPDVNVTYDPAGSGAGREQFIAGGVGFAGSDAILGDDELAGEFAACAPDTLPVDLPVYISPIAVIFNVEGVESLNMDAATIAGIFSDQITNWNDPAIAELNPDVTLPDAPITAVHRSDDSGTTENFTEYLAATAPDVWTEGVFETWAYGGEGAQGTSGVVDAVTNGTNTIGYADASRAGGLGTVALQVGEEFVPFSAEAAAAAVDASPRIEGRHEGDIAVELDRTTTEAGVYPLVLISYAIACTDYEDDATAELVKAYLSYIVSAEGQSAAEANAGNSPISDALRDEVLAVIDTIQ